MEISQQSQKELLKRKKEQKALAKAFQGLFGSDLGKVVFGALKKFAKSDIVVIPLDDMGRTDPIEMGRNDGKRGFIVYIESMLNKTFNQKEQENAEL